MSAQPGRDSRRGGNLLPLGLAALVVVSAIGVVQLKHRDRQLTTQLEKLRQDREQLELEWAQLQLEEATFAQHGRVDELARKQFGMVDPADYKIVDAANGPIGAPK